MTSLGRQVRLGTASMITDPGGALINVDRLDLKKYAARPSVAKLLCDYLLYHDRNPVKALELASHATVHVGYNDWWWKARLGKAYYQLGETLPRDPLLLLTPSHRTPARRGEAVQERAARPADGHDDAGAVQSVRAHGPAKVGPGVPGPRFVSPPRAAVARPDMLR